MDVIGDSKKAVSTGTTTVAACFDGGVVIGADSRVTTGSYIVNRSSNKVVQVTDKIFCARSGSAAHTQTVSDYVKYYLSLHTGEVQQPPAVRAAAALFQNMLYSNKNMLEGSIILAGFDEQKEKGEVYMIPIGGALFQQQFSIGGSGSTYLYGWADSTFKSNFTRAECENWVQEAISMAMHRDGSSGGCMRYVTITKDGSERFFVDGNNLRRHWREEGRPIEL